MAAAAPFIAPVLASVAGAVVSSALAPKSDASFGRLEEANRAAEERALADQRKLDEQRESRERAIASTTRGRRSLLSLTGEVGVEPLAIGRA